MIKSDFEFEMVFDKDGLIEILGKAGYVLPQQSDLCFLSVLFYDHEGKIYSMSGQSKIQVRTITGKVQVAQVLEESYEG